ncbi:MAG: 6-pyruvoyl trahydropterin synthase family protein [Acidibrevibacterium sp.]|uniref:6-pyruvoyl trahydropterin synthase family protein n=1 Tax=Acidibrevibacterium sp. TaxID=2606776 RepID=UPI003D068830
MYSLTVCDHVMIAHSFQGAVFGPAQRLHGATYAVEAEFRAPILDADHLVVDIGLAGQALRRVLDTVDYRNLDEMAEFAGRNTTTEFLAAHIHALLADACREGALGEGGRRLSGLKILLRESPRAFAAFEGPIGAEGAA